MAFSLLLDLLKIMVAPLDFPRSHQEAQILLGTAEILMLVITSLSFVLCTVHWAHCSYKHKSASPAFVSPFAT